MDATAAPATTPTATAATAATAATGAGTVGQPLRVLGHEVTLLDSPGEYVMLEGLCMPDIPGPPPHHHPFSEFFYVAEGDLDLMTDGTWQRLAQGQSITLAPGVVHTFRNPGATPTRFVTGFTPRGFERFFATFGIPADQPDAMAASVAPALIERVLREADSFGMHLAAAP
jgi:quercetin dioxygenase-like cupin family protein